MYTSWRQCVKHSLWLNSISFFSVWTTSLHPSSSWWVLRLLLFLAFMNVATVNRGMQMSLLYDNFISFWRVAGENIADSIFSILWETFTVISPMAVLVVLPTVWKRSLSPRFCRHTSLVFCFYNEHPYWRRTLIVVCLVLQCTLKQVFPDLFCLLIVHLFFGSSIEILRFMFNIIVIFDRDYIESFI